MTGRHIPANPARMADGVRDTAQRIQRARSGSMGSTLAGTVYTDSSNRQRVPSKTRTGSGAPSFCWVCGNQLQRAPGKGQGLFFFNLVTDRVGVEHRVHGDCTQQAINDGCKVVPEAPAATGAAT